MPNTDNLSPEGKAHLARYEALTASYPDSEVTQIPDDGDYDHRLIQQALLSAQVCTRKTAVEAAAWLSTVRPPGTSYNRWEFDPEQGEVTCEQFPDTHRHVIVNC
jgi:hypothetical protein